MDNRNRMGKNKDGVIFPVAPNLSEMSDNYLQFIEEIKEKNPTTGQSATEAMKKVCMMTGAFLYFKNIELTKLTKNPS